MALIKCPECGKEVSDQAEVCIHCGYPLTAKKAESGETAPGTAEEKQELKQEPQQESKEKTGGKAKAGSTLLVVFVMVLLLVIGYFMMTKLAYG